VFRRARVVANFRREKRSFVGKTTIDEIVGAPVVVARGFLRLTHARERSRFIFLPCTTGVAATTIITSFMD